MIYTLSENTSYYYIYMYFVKALVGYGMACML